MKGYTPIWIAAVALLLSAENGFAQDRKPSPTGQIPKSYAGQSNADYSGYKPKPTGQIAPAAGTVPAAQAMPARATTNMEGQVPKVNSNQDPRTFPERYNPGAVAPSEDVLSIQQTSILPNPSNQQPAAQQIETTITSQEVNTANPTQQPVNQGQNANTRPAGTNQQQNTGQQQTTTQQKAVAQPKAAGVPGPVPSAPQRLQPNY